MSRHVDVAREQRKLCHPRDEIRGMARNGQDAAVVRGVGMQIQQPGAASLCGGRTVGDEPFVTALRDVRYGQQQQPVPPVLRVLLS